MVEKEAETDRKKALIGNVSIPQPPSLPSLQELSSITDSSLREVQPGCTSSCFEHLGENPTAAEQGAPLSCSRDGGNHFAGKNCLGLELHVSVLEGSQSL